MTDAHFENDALLPDYMFQPEAAKYLRTTGRNIALWRKSGLLKAVKSGKAYVYKRSWLDQFMEDWSGYDMSSETKVRFAINSESWKEKHN